MATNVEGTLAKSVATANREKRTSLATATHHYREEVAPWCSTSTSFTTCVTFGTRAAMAPACDRAACESTFPFRVTTPFLTEYFTSLFSRLATRAASRFL